MGIKKSAILITLALMLTLIAPVKQESALATPTTSEQELQTKLQTYFANKHAKYTLSLREINRDGSSGHQVGVADTLHIEPASVVKLFWAWAVLKKVDEGRLSLSSTLKTGFTWGSCLNLMIKISDNDCSAWIREALGNATLNAQLLAEGYVDTKIVLDSTRRYKTKYTSAADTSLLLERLERGTLLSEASTTYFHNLLKQQVFRTRITPGVQKGFVVENKGGNLWVNPAGPEIGWTESDAAIVRGPVSTYILVIYGRNDAKKAEITAASRIVYEHLQGQTVTASNSFARRQYVIRSAVWIRRTPNGRGIYKAPSGALVELYFAQRDWVKVKQNGKTAGYVRFAALALHPSYIWP